MKPSIFGSLGGFGPYQGVGDETLDIHQGLVFAGRNSPQGREMKLTIFIKDPCLLTVPASEVGR